MPPTTPEKPLPDIDDQAPWPPRRSRLDLPWPRRAWQRWLVGLVLTVTLLLGTALGLRLWWGWRAHESLQRFIDELHARGQPVTLEDFQPRPIPEAQNAASLLVEAQSLLEREPAGSAAARLLRDYCFDPELIRRDRARVSKLLGEVGPVFECIAQARGRARCQWPVPLTHPVINGSPPPFSSQRELGKLLIIRAVERAAAGDHAAAMEAIEDGLNLADWVQDEPPSLIAHLVGLSITAIDLEALEAILPELAVAPPASGDARTRPVPRERMRRLIARLLDEDSAAMHWRRAVWAERLQFYDTMLAIRRGTLGPVPGVPSAAQGSRAMGWILAPIWELDTLFAMRHLTALAEAASKPSWPQAAAAAPKRPAWKGPLQQFKHVLSSILMPSLDRALELHYRAVATRRLAAVAIAVRLYEVDHGRRPQTLAALVPEYLAAVPIDPYTDPPVPLRYAPHHDPPVIYSVHNDGHDDGGRLYVPAAGRSRPRNTDLVWLLDGHRPHERSRPAPVSDPNAAAASQPSSGTSDEASGHTIASQPREPR